MYFRSEWKSSAKNVCKRETKRIKLFRCNLNRIVGIVIVIVHIFFLFFLMSRQNLYFLYAIPLCSYFDLHDLYKSFYSHSAISYNKIITIFLCFVSFWNLQIFFFFHGFMCVLFYVCWKQSIDDVPLKKIEIKKPREK